MFDFHVVPGTAIKSLLDANPRQSIDIVKNAYLAHHDGQTVNPDSYFLRFPNNANNRIIALPAAIDGAMAVSGIKWIASFPGNIERGIARASATLLLNDSTTGYPFACLECSQISAVRTAASAVLGAYFINQQNRHAKSIGFIGAGVINRNIFDMFMADDWQFERVVVHDKHTPSLQALAHHIESKIPLKVQQPEDVTAALEADIVVFATNAGTPWVEPTFSFRPGQIVLNISLRDLAPEQILAAENLFDDVDHCMKAQTSPHLAEQRTGNREFVTGTLAALMRGEITLNHTRPLIYSPFGMGMLDLAMGKHLYDQAIIQGSAIAIPGFFADTNRW